MKSLKTKHRDEKKQCENITMLLYETALINSGFVLEKPAEYSNKVNKLVELGFCDEEEEDNYNFNLLNSPHVIFL